MLNLPFPPLVLVILQFFPKFYTISPGLAMLPLLVVLAITAAKDGYEDLKRHQSDSHINGLKVSTLHGGGWHNPNVMEEKSRSVSSVWRTFWARSFGGKKRESDRMRKEQGARASMAIEHGEDDEAPMVSPMEPPGDAPGGGSAQGPRAVPPVRSVGEPHLGLVPEGEVAPYEPTSPTSPTARHSLAPPARPSRQLRRHSTVASSAFESEYEHHPDGTITRKDGGEMTDDHHMRAQAKKAPRWKRKDWEDLAVGDFIFLRNNEAIPADVVICATSEEEDSCFIETKNLDGETNLKSRHAIPELTTLRTPADCMHASLRIDSEAPDTNMYRLNASVVMGDRLGKDGQPLRCPVTLNQVLLRGCNLRNTEWVIGIVLMTGVDTKIIANSGDTPSKRGKVEKQMNPMV